MGSVLHSVTLHAAVLYVGTLSVCPGCRARILEIQFSARAGSITVPHIADFNPRRRGLYATMMFICLSVCLSVRWSSVASGGGCHRCFFYRVKLPPRQIYACDYSLLEASV